MKLNDEDLEFLSDEEIEDLIGISGLINKLREIPQEYVAVINLPRYAEVVASIKQIAKFIRENADYCDIQVEIDQIVGTSMTVVVTTDLVSVSEISDFCKSLEAATTFEIAPVSGNVFSIGLTYEDVKIRMDATN